jgi:hypothetical protein
MNDGMTNLDMTHFEGLRARINRRLRELGTPNAELQIEHYPWLYGALGEVPSEVMFICENPSLTGVGKAHVDTIDGRLPDIEAQWWGGYNDPAARRFRPVLRRLGLKQSHSASRGGWKCYITNVVKEANLAGLEQDSKDQRERIQQARQWADVLCWEFERAQPKHVFCVGRDAFAAVQRLQSEGLLPKFTPHYVCHYSARGRDDRITDQMLSSIRAVLGRPGRLQAPDEEHQSMTQAEMRTNPKIAEARPSLSRPISSPTFAGATDLSGRELTVASEFRDSNPRLPFTHGWLAFEVLRQAPEGSLPFEEYQQRLFSPTGEIRALARQIPGKKDAYHDLKHVRCDIFRGAVIVRPPLPRAWFDVQRCSPGTKPNV